MQLGLIGLGKMGNNMRERLRTRNIEVIGYDQNPAISDVGTLAELAKALTAPRIVWVMVPSGEITSSVISALAAELDAGDLIIDGGNSRFTEDLRHAAEVAVKGIEYVDAGVSGGNLGP